MMPTDGGRVGVDILVVGGQMMTVSGRNLGFAVFMADGQMMPTDAWRLGAGQPMVGGQMMTVSEAALGFVTRLADGQVLDEAVVVHAATT